VLPESPLFAVTSLANGFATSICFQANLWALAGVYRVTGRRLFSWCSVYLLLLERSGPAHRTGTSRLVAAPSVVRRCVTYFCWKCHGFSASPCKHGDVGHQKKTNKQTVKLIMHATNARPIT